MKNVITIIILIFASNIIFAQSTTDSIKKAEISSRTVYTEDFSGAIIMYKQMLSFDHKNPVFNYKLGFCYLNTFKKQDSAIYFLETASQLYSKKNEKEININEIYFYLARAYRVNCILDSAAIILERLKTKSYDEEFLKVVDNEIELTLKALHNDFDIDNLGSIINSPYTEHSPVISEDKKTLIFTSRKKRDENSNIYDDGEYDEDIYISRRIDGKWTEPELISDNINTSENEASTCISCDGTKLFLYKDKNRGSLFYSEMINDSTWSEPIKLGKNINTRSRETHASISCDNKYLFFTSDRRGGYGGLDIYMSKIQVDGKWGEPVNLGAGVNSAGDEEGPYIQDSTTLFFSSNGHKGYGKFDIYKSQLTEFGTWGYAENLGYPINSINNDVYYVPIAHTENAFYASYKAGGYGNTDIYLLTKTNEEEKKLTINIGYLETCNGRVPQATINIDNITTGEHAVAKANEMGQFIFVTQKEEVYKLTVEHNGEIVFTDNFNVPRNTPFKQHYQTIRVECD